MVGVVGVCELSGLRVGGSLTSLGSEIGAGPLGWCLSLLTSEVAAGAREPPGTAGY
jgi:hypothetical protein